jgi:hypothetical protein
MFTIEKGVSRGTELSFREKLPKIYDKTPKYMTPSISTTSQFLTDLEKET